MDNDLPVNDLSGMPRTLVRPEPCNTPAQVYTENITDQPPYDPILIRRKVIQAQQTNTLLRLIRRMERELEAARRELAKLERDVEENQA